MNTPLSLFALAAAVGLLPLAAPGQVEIDWDAVGEIVDGGVEWIGEQTGIDLEPVVDPARIQASFRKLDSALQGEYVLDLALVREEATALLDVLNQYEETRPYAAWLAARMDYFDVAETLRPPPPVQPAARPTPPPPNPPPARQRAAWKAKVAERPAPRNAEALVPGLKRIFAGLGTPEELVWLAEVESSFNPAARSPVGAVGLYQFMPRTAESLGLSLRPTDERTLPEKSAGAAATYLNQLYRRFEDWPLALAAYNAGQGRVGKLLKQQEATRFDQIATRLPAETQMYVPKIDAVLQKREGVSLDRLPAPARP